MTGKAKNQEIAVGPTAHTLWMFVQFGDVDHAGILYYPKMFHYAHLAYEDYLRGLPGWSLPDCFNLQHIGTPVVSTESTFLGPLAHGEKVAVEVVVERVGQRSFTLAFRLCDADSMAVRARIRVVHAIVSLETFQSIPIPEPLRNYLSPEEAEGEAPDLVGNDVD